MPREWLGESDPVALAQLLVDVGIDRRAVEDAIGGYVSLGGGDGR